MEPNPAPGAPAATPADQLPAGRPVHVAVVDLDGVPRGKRLGREKVLAALAGAPLGWCNVVFGWDLADAPYDNTALSGWHTGYPDAPVRLDAATLRHAPWHEGEAFMLGDFDGGGPLGDICPRTALRRVLAKAAGMGYRVDAAVEYEWFVFDAEASRLALKRGTPPRPATIGMHGYSLLRPDQNAAFVRALWTGLEAFGVPLEGLHTETGPGAFEAAPRYADALAAADRAVCFKLAVKQMARRHGLVASFMAKWRDDLPGCGGHVHQSLVELATGRNVFAARDGGGASGEADPAARAYLAGQLAWLPHVLPLYAPTVNSYKRLVPGSWAATTATWGRDNRTTALRLLGNRLETRVPGADANPYLALAAAVASGLDGIERGRTPPPPVAGDAYAAPVAGAHPPLPRTLAEATAALRARAAEVAALLGADAARPAGALVDHFVRTREWECARHRAAVTDWERRRYLEAV